MMERAFFCTDAPGDKSDDSPKSVFSLAHEWTSSITLYKIA